MTQMINKMLFALYDAYSIPIRMHARTHIKNHYKPGFNNYVHVVIINMHDSIKTMNNHNTLLVRKKTIYIYLYLFSIHFNVFGRQQNFRIKIQEFSVLSICVENYCISRKLESN